MTLGRREGLKSWCPSSPPRWCRGPPGHTLRGLCVTPPASPRVLLREGFDLCPAVSSRDPCGTCMLLPVGMWHTPCGCHSGVIMHHSALHLLFCTSSTRVVSLHRLCVCKSCVSLGGVTRCSPFKVYVHVGGLSSPCQGRSPGTTLRVL